MFVCFTCAYAVVITRELLILCRVVCLLTNSEIGYCEECIFFFTEKHTLRVYISFTDEKTMGSNG